MTPVRMEHTKTPWIHDSEFEGTLIKDNKGNVICEVDLPKIRKYGYDKCAEIQQSNAQHIVKCVNSHETLVDIIKTILGQIEEGIPFHATSNNEKLLKQALTKAGE